MVRIRFEENLTTINDLPLAFTLLLLLLPPRLLPVVVDVVVELPGPLFSLFAFRLFSSVAAGFQEQGAVKASRLATTGDGSMSLWYELCRFRPADGAVSICLPHHVPEHVREVRGWSREAAGHRSAIVEAGEGKEKAMEIQLLDGAFLHSSSGTLLLAIDSLSEMGNLFYASNFCEIMNKFASGMRKAIGEGIFLMMPGCTPVSIVARGRVE